MGWDFFVCFISFLWLVHLVCFPPEEQRKEQYIAATSAVITAI